MTILPFIYPQRFDVRKSGERNRPPSIPRADTVDHPPPIENSSVWSRSLENRDLVSLDATMRRLSSVDSSTKMRIGSASSCQRVVKKTLLILRCWCAKVRREIEPEEGTHREDRLDETVNVASVMRLEDEEFWNLTNENLENELRELAVRSEP
ncbi:hypothetical protein KM043_016314 [Ampulex compressa]|nr:hypothetical protein KM043_016314 [Ampulex compressa]